MARGGGTVVSDRSGMGKGWAKRMGTASGGPVSRAELLVRMAWGRLTACISYAPTSFLRFVRSLPRNILLIFRDEYGWNCCSIINGFLTGLIVSIPLTMIFYVYGSPGIRGFLDIYCGLVLPSFVIATALFEVGYVLDTLETRVNNVRERFKCSDLETLYKRRLILLLKFRILASVLALLGWVTTINAETITTLIVRILAPAVQDDRSGLALAIIVIY